MENASYALRIVAATLIAIMIIALAIYAFNNIRAYQKAQDEVVSRESITTFNEAFEVYDKNLMYGTDVLSCLNKALNNNQEYVYNATSFEEELLINVTVKLKSTIQETIKVNYKESSGAIMEATSSYTYYYYPFKSSSDPHFEIPSVTYYYFKTSGETSELLSGTGDYISIMGADLSDTFQLKPGTYDTSMKADEEYNLVGQDSSDSTSTSQLTALLSTVTSFEQTIYKKNFSGSGDTNWYSATWRTGAYDFKTRKFKCNKIEYSDSTGYVKSIEFEEVDS